MNNDYSFIEQKRRESIMENQAEFYKAKRASGGAAPETPRDAHVKESNPKEAEGAKKLQLQLVPSTAVAMMALAFYEGAHKYGSYNWRVKGARASTYVAAAKRHLDKWFDGENTDPDTGVPHLASVMACCAIILDSLTLCKLTDDRPPRSPLNALHEGLANIQQKLAADTKHAKGYTQEDVDEH